MRKTAGARKRRRHGKSQAQQQYEAWLEERSFYDDEILEEFEQEQVPYDRRLAILQVTERLVTDRPALVRAAAALN